MQTMTRRCSVIKAGAAVAAGGGASPAPFQLTDVLAEAERTLDDARREAQRIVREAHASADALRRAAREEGYRTGFEQGSREGRDAGRAEALDAARKDFADQQKDLIASCQATIREIDAGRAAWKAAARQDLVDLAMAIARRVVRYVGEHERQAVLANLEQAVELAGARSEVTLAVNPKDADAARVFAHSLAEMNEQWEHVRVIEEPDVSPGGCRVQWGSGAIDATLETQLDRIDAELSSAGPPRPADRERS